MFVATTGTRCLNLDHVREFKLHWNRDPKGDCSISGEYADGSVFHAEILHSTYQDLMDIGHGLPRAVTPSPPGYVLLSYWNSESTGEVISREAVIAWELDRDDAFHAVYTAFSAPGSPSPQHVLCPEGYVVDCGSSIWDNEALWLDDMRKQDADKKAREKAAQEERQLKGKTESAHA